MKTFWRLFRRSRVGVAGGVVLIFLIICAIAAPLLTPYDPGSGDLHLRLHPPVWSEGGDWNHPLGCDQQGRDVLSRILYGARVSLLVGLVVVVASAESADECLEICRNHSLGTDARMIGEVVQTRDIPTVELITGIGGRRIVQMPYGRELPRIC